jgi:hypothetical protein
MRSHPPIREFRQTEAAELSHMLLSTDISPSRLLKFPLNK